MIITHKRGKGKKIHIFVDDEYQITTDIDFWAENYINDNTDISDKEWDNLVLKINYRKAVNKCFDLLSRRDHSIKELRDKLNRTLDPVSTDKAIDRMIELGYLDDEKYAQDLIKFLVEVKKFSLYNVKQECYKRGISREIFEPIIDDIDIDGVSSALYIIKSKYLNKLALDGGRNKVIAALMRKGFSYGDICSALGKIENAQEDEY